MFHRKYGDITMLRCIDGAGRVTEAGGFPPSLLPSFLLEEI